LRGIAPKEYTVTANPAKKPEVSASGPAFILGRQRARRMIAACGTASIQAEFGHLQRK
jgi:hypothetical protein